MAKFINMPKMGNTVTSVIFSEWNVKEGDNIKVGDKLFSYETDKTTTDEVAKEAGTVLKLLVKPDDEVLVFAPVMIVGQPGEDISALLKEVNVSEVATPVLQREETKSNIEDSTSNQTKPDQTPEEQKQDQNITKPIEQTSPSSSNNGISPRALKALKRSGIGINNITYGSGPRGRIVSQDITKAMLKPQSFTQEIKINQSDSINQKIQDIISNSKGQGDEKFLYPPMRKAISKGMVASQKQSAFVTLTLTIDAYQLLQARKALKAAAQQTGVDISINDLIIFACSKVLPKYKQTINAHVFDEEAVLHSHANIAVAVDTPNGLIVPVIKTANLKSLKEISQEAKTIITAARKGDFKSVDLKSGTFTISNVGSMGIEVFTPVLNAGQAAILGVGTTVLKPRKNHEGLVEFYNAMFLSLTVDHRLVDGADGARFLNDLKLVLENIQTLINLEA